MQNKKIFVLLFRNFNSEINKAPESKWRVRMFSFLILFILIGIIPIFSLNAQTLCQQLATAMDADADDGLTSCSLSGDSRAFGVFSGNSNTLPTEGSTFAILSTGLVSQIPGVPATFISTDFGAVGTSGDTINLTLNFTVPATANCLSFDFEFLSEEYPEFVTSAFNDYFWALLNGTNISFDNDGNEITVNNNYFFGLLPPNAFDGATPRLTTTAQVTPGSNITLVFRVADEGDGIFDSAVFIDRLRIRYRKPGMCTPGTVYCTDNDDDGYYIEGGACGAVDCDDNDNCVNPGMLEEMTPGLCNLTTYNEYVNLGCNVQQYTHSCGSVCVFGCGDNKDNDCNGLVDDQEERCPKFLFGGLVPCGRNLDDLTTEDWENCPCRFCHFLVLADRIVDFALINIIIPLAVLMVVVGGAMFLTAGGSTERISSAKKIITATIIGILIIFTAWVIVNTILMLIGVADWTGLKTDWWQINCPVPGICNDSNQTCKLPGEP